MYVLYVYIYIYLCVYTYNFCYEFFICDEDGQCTSRTSCFQMHGLPKRNCGVITRRAYAFMIMLFFSIW